MDPVHALRLHDFNKAAFLDIGSKINGSLVYLDAGSAQLIQMNVGVGYLFSIGASNVCDLSDPHNDDALFAVMQGRSCSTICVFITQLLTNSHNDILNAVMMHPSVKTLHIFSDLTEYAHANLASSLLGVEAYKEYTDHLQKHLKEGAIASGQDPSSISDLQISIQHFPLSMCPLDSTSFVLPAHSAAARLARSAGRAAGYMGADTGLVDRDEADGVQPPAYILAHALASICSLLNVKPHPYCLGPVSQQLAVELAEMPIPPPPSPAHDTDPPKPMALILVDRNLDLISPARHPDHLCDTMLALLPRAPSTSLVVETAGVEPVIWRGLDVRVDVGPAYPLEDPVEGGGRLGSSWFHPEDSRSLQWLDDLMGRQGKDTGLYLRKWLKEALRGEKIPAPVRSKAGAPPPSELAALAQALAEKPGASLRNKAILTLGYAAAAALGGEVAQRWEAAAALEKQVLMAAREDPETTAAVVLDALSTIRQGKGLLQVEDVVAVLLQLYCLLGDEGGPFPSPVEADIAEALTSALLEGGRASGHILPKNVQSLLAQGDSEKAREAVRGAVEALMGTLRQAVVARQHMAEFRDWTSPTSGYGRDPHTGIIRSTSSMGGAPVPLIRQLVDRIIQEDPLTELHPPTSAVRGFLSKGLGRLGLQHQRLKPCECPVVLVFVVGGVSMLEVREVRQEVGEHELRARKPLVLVGGTSLVGPEDVVARAFGG